MQCLSLHYLFSHFFFFWGGEWGGTNKRKSYFISSHKNYLIFLYLWALKKCFVSHRWSQFLISTSVKPLHSCKECMSVARPAWPPNILELLLTTATTGQAEKCSNQLKSTIFFLPNLHLSNKSYFDAAWMYENLFGNAVSHLWGKHFVERLHGASMFSL